MCERLANYLYLSAEFRVSGALPQLPLISLWRAQGQRLPLVYVIENFAAFSAGDFWDFERSYPGQIQGIVVWIQQGNISKGCDNMEYSLNVKQVFAKYKYIGFS